MRNNETAIIGTMEKEATETEEKQITDEEFVLNLITDVRDHNMTESEINNLLYIESV